MINIFEIYSDGFLPRFLVVHIAGSVGRQIGLTVLILWNLEFAPIETDCILHEK